MGKLRVVVMPVSAQRSFAYTFILDPCLETPGHENLCHSLHEPRLNNKMTIVNCSSCSAHIGSR